MYFSPAIIFVFFFVLPSNANEHKIPHFYGNKTTIVTALGGTANLKCEVKDLGDYSVKLGIC